MLRPGLTRVGWALRSRHERLVTAGLAPGHHDYRRFVIVARARTGSNLLVSLLRSHPRVDARGELLLRLDGATVPQRLEEIYGRKPKHIRAVGFKCFYYHPLDDPDAPVWTHLAAIDQLHVLHLRRRNTLRTLTSRRLADLTGEWIEHRPLSGERLAAKPKVRFSADELRAELEQDEAWARACQQRFSDHPMLDVVYEDLVSTPATREGILTFLGVSPRSLRTTLQRQNPEPLAELIEGFDDLRREFEHTRWASLFDETSP